MHLTKGGSFGIPDQMSCVEIGYLHKHMPAIKCICQALMMHKPFFSRLCVLCTAVERNGPFGQRVGEEREREREREEKMK